MIKDLRKKIFHKACGGEKEAMTNKTNLVFLHQRFNSLLKRKKIIINDGNDNILVDISSNLP